MKLQFEWNKVKRISNLKKHKIDFEDAILIFEHSISHIPSRFKGEERWITLGELNGIMILVVWTWRDPKIRIISARRLRENEKRKYQDNDP